MSFGVDTLGGLIEKLKQLVNETQDQYESFFDNTQLFKQGKMDNKEYFTKMGEYLVSSSALNFLTSRIILEIKTVLDKGTSRKSSTGDSSSISTSPPGLGGSSSRSGSGGGGGGSGFGVDSFVNSGGSVNSLNKDYDLPKPQEAPSFKPVDIMISKQDFNTIREQKNCIVCAALIPKQAKFCNKCGNSQ
jgi:ribosomal protein L40E